MFRTTAPSQIGLPKWLGCELGCDLHDWNQKVDIGDPFETASEVQTEKRRNGEAVMGP